METHGVTLKIVLTLCIFLIPHSFIISVTSFEAESSENTSSVLLARAKVKIQDSVIHTCCPIDLSKKGTVRCKKASPDDDFTSSTTLTIPSHLMAENETTTLKLEVKKAHCLPLNMNVKYLHWAPSATERQTKFLKNGYIKVETQYYPPDEYCINGKNESALEVYVCPQDCRGPRPCIRKCCSLDKVYSFGFTPGGLSKGCFSPGGDEYFSPTLFKDFIHTVKESKDLAPHYIEKYPSDFKFDCPSNRTIPVLFPNINEAIYEAMNINFTSMPFRIRTDGKFLHKEPDGNCGIMDPAVDNLCVDGIMNYGSTLQPFFNDPEELVLFVCLLSPSPEDAEYGSYVFGGLMILSSIFLLLTAAVYILLWERQTVHGWTILSHTISLFFLYIFLGTAHLIRVTLKHDGLNTPGCAFVGMMSHFFFLSTFCWLSLISIDLWLTFRAITPRRGANSKGLSRYIKYSVLGWGVPTVIVAVGWILTSSHPVEACSTVITPAYGVYSCYLQEKALGVYLYYPIAFMMFLNVLFFVLTTVKLYFYRKSTKLATKDDNQQQFYRLFFKLFFVMGVMYVFELISWSVSGMGFFWYWAIFDILNILRALAVFIIFVCKPDIIGALEQNYPWLKPILIPIAYIVRTKEQRSQASRRGESESVGLNSFSTKSITIRSTDKY